MARVPRSAVRNQPGSFSLARVALTFGTRLLPFAALAGTWVMGAGLFERLVRSPGLSREALPFLAGLGSYALIHLFLFRPLFLHTLAHELAHSIASALLGGKVLSLHIEGGDSGRVVLSRHNRFVALAPYLFPLFGIALLLLATIATEPVRPGLLVLLGFATAMHFVLTLRDLSLGQPDIRESGRFFALPLVAFSGVLFLSLALAAADPTRFSFDAVLDAGLRSARSEPGGRVGL